MLTLEQLRYNYSDSDGQHSWCFDLNAAAATVTSISGASGGGKSTLLELIAGLLQPESGQLRWRERNLLPLPAGQRPISLLFQQHNLFEHISALDNVLLGHHGKPDKAAQEMALNALDEMGLADKAQSRADKLSGGQQQRVALARTLVRRSEIVLLDEPFSALDDDTRHSVRPLVRALADKHNCCVLMVTHDRRDSDAVADHQLMVKDGQLSSAQ